MPDIDETSLIELMGMDIAEVVRRYYGGNFTLLSKVPDRIFRRYSFIFRYKVESEKGDVRMLFVKIPHQSWMKTIAEAISSDELRDEVRFDYGVMNSVFKVIHESGNSELTAIEPVGVLDKWNAIIVEELQLIMLKDYLSKISIMMGNPESWEDFSKKLGLAGKWLRIVHDSFSLKTTMSLRALGLFEKIEKQIAYLDIKNKSVILDLQKKIALLRNTLLEMEMPVSSAHDDYHLGNVFVLTDGRVGALDLNWKENYPIYNDLSKILIDPSTRKFQIATLGLSFRPSLQDKYDAAILKGYFGESHVPEQALWLYCFLAVLEKWNSNLEVLDTTNSGIIRSFRPVLRWYFQWYFIRLLYRYVNKAINNRVN